MGCWRTQSGSCNRASLTVYVHSFLSPKGRAAAGGSWSVNCFVVFKRSMDHGEPSWYEQEKLLNGTVLGRNPSDHSLCAKRPVSWIVPVCIHSFHFHLDHGGLGLQSFIFPTWYNKGFTEHFWIETWLDSRSKKHMIMAPKYFFKKCFFVRERKEESIPKPYYQVVLPDMTFKTN